MQNAVDDNDRFLDDKSLYDFSSDWERFLYYIPKLISNYEDNAEVEDDRRPKMTEKEIVDFRKAQAALLLASPPSAKLEPPSSIIWLIFNMRFSLVILAEVEVQDLSTMQSNIHKACMVNYIIVEENEALLSETKTKEGLVRLIFLDSYGYVVRSNRISTGYVEQMGGQWL